MKKQAATTKPLVIVAYDAEWPRFFHEEAERIKAFMGETVADLHHIGSTSVPGLSAKPIVDMLLVTRDLEEARQHLTSSELGYRYKGEYNLPLRDLYGKSGPCETYLHVHQVGNPEIALNVLFRDFLRDHRDAREHYERAKLAASQSSGAGDKVEAGITQYNLRKNDSIVSILRNTGFDSLCVRFVAQHREHEAFEQFRSEFFEQIGGGDLTEVSAESKKFVLYQGTEIIGSAGLSDGGAGRASIDFAISETPEGFLRLLQVIEAWVMLRMQADSLSAVALQEQSALYVSAGFVALQGARGSGKVPVWKRILNA
ncbi:MAG: GrpB family protein [Holosporales bacterium]|jgi:GrpB-like predicted nucleotidyltransferase (UPF0157 family)|nr:GrpB family protein [Holosporales bacterium]